MREPQRDRGLRHELVEVLFIALVAMVSGTDDAEAMEEFGESNETWFRQFMALPHGIPSQDTVLRVFALLDPGVVQTMFRDWVWGAPESSWTADEQPQEPPARPSRTRPVLGQAQA